VNSGHRERGAIPLPADTAAGVCEGHARVGIPRSVQVGRLRPLVLLTAAFCALGQRCLSLVELKLLAELLLLLGQRRVFLFQLLDGYLDLAAAPLVLCAALCPSADLDHVGQPDLADRDRLSECDSLTESKISRSVSAFRSGVSADSEFVSSRRHRCRYACG